MSGGLINANKKLTIGFPTSHQSRSCVTPNFPKMGFIYQNLSFFHRKFDQKPLNVCYRVSFSENFQRQWCSAINYLSNGINILAGDDRVPVKFAPKGTGPNRKDARFTFHTRHAVQSATADLIVVARWWRYLKNWLIFAKLVTHSPYLLFWKCLTLSLPIPLRLYTLSYWSNPPFLISDIRALWRSGLSTRVPECQTLKMAG